MLDNSCVPSLQSLSFQALYEKEKSNPKEWKKIQKTLPPMELHTSVVDIRWEPLFGWVNLIPSKKSKLRSVLEKLLASNPNKSKSDVNRNCGKEVVESKIKVPDVCVLDMSFEQSGNRYKADVMKITFPNKGTMTYDIVHEWGTSIKKTSAKLLEDFVVDELQLEKEDKEIVLVALYWINDPVHYDWSTRIHAMFPSALGFEENLKTFPQWYIDVALKWTRSKVLK